MRSVPPDVENRQSPRIVLRVPLEIRTVEALSEATSTVVNQHGALILAPVPYPVGARLDIENMETHRSTPVGVVWSGGPDAKGDCEVGIAFKRRVTNFWGEDHRRRAGDIRDTGLTTGGAPTHFRPLRSALSRFRLRRRSA